MDDMKLLLDALYEIRDDVDFETGTALVDDGLIDSLDLTQIIAALMDSFGVRVLPREIEPENFNSVQAMLALVNRLKETGHA